MKQQHPPRSLDSFREHIVSFFEVPLCSVILVQTGCEDGFLRDVVPLAQDSPRNLVLVEFLDRVLAGRILAGVFGFFFLLTTSGFTDVRYSGESVRLKLELYLLRCRNVVADER